MASLKELRTRISSVKTTKQMTSAMKMVAAAKLRKAQQAITQVRPYADKIHSMLENLVNASFDDIDNIFFKKRKINKILIILISSNRGLCGAFNSNVEKLATKTINEYLKNGYSPENIEVYPIGKRGAEAMKRLKYNIFKTNYEIFDNLSYKQAQQIAQELTELYKNTKFDKIEIIYNSFKNAATQIITKQQFLPISQNSNKKVNGDYVYEPNHKTVLKKLIPESLTMQIYRALLDSYAAEHGARMTAMHKATDNATDLIHDLTLSYNKARQAAITKEILEIVGGAEALKS